MKTIMNVAVCLWCLGCMGCTSVSESGFGFTMPPGDADRGNETFAALQCHACHTVAGVEFGPLENSSEKMIKLGGEKSVPITYGELVTSIINPSHRFAYGYTDDESKIDGESKMRRYNDEMTVTQLTDLVSFLQSHYEIKAYQPNPYMPYY